MDQFGYMQVTIAENLGEMNLMYRYHFDEMSGSDNIVVAKLVSPAVDNAYQFKREKFPDVYIRNRGLAYQLSFKGYDSEEAQKVRAAVDDYNEYLTKVEAIPGFIDFFKQNGFCVSRKKVSDNWSEKIADLVFSKKSYSFYTNLTIIHDFLFDSSLPAIYQANIEGYSVDLPIGKPDTAYANMINSKKAIWNWVDNGHDFCLYLWMLLGEPEWQCQESEEIDVPVCYNFDIYDQTRLESVEPQLVNIFKKLESLGYIHSYTIKPEYEDPRWFDYGKTNETIDLALVDTSFLKNRLVMEQIELLLWQRSDDIKEGQYFLTDRKGKQYISDHRGALGGHCKLKIYGSLNCPSAARYIAKGQYVKHRVFFEDEETAVAAGYRPCAVCMKEKYKQWKMIEMKK